MMASEEVLRVLDLLAGAGVDVWVDGGWGIDALLGEQTRPHNDLDIALDHDHVPRFMDVMRAAGYTGVRIDPGGGPMNFVVRDAQGHEVDVHLVDLSTTRTSDRGVEVYGPRGLEYEGGCLNGVGTIGGRQSSVLHCRIPDRIPHRL